MLNLSIYKACPHCQGISLYRIRRTGWMRLIPTSKHFECDSCRTKFLVLPPGMHKSAHKADTHVWWWRSRLICVSSWIVNSNGSDCYSRFQMWHPSSWLRLLHQTQGGHGDGRPGRVGTEGFLDFPAAVVDARSIPIFNGSKVIHYPGQLMLKQPVIIGPADI